MTGQNDRQDRSLTGQVRDDRPDIVRWPAVICSPEEVISDFSAR